MVCTAASLQGKSSIAGAGINQGWGSAKRHSEICLEGRYARRSRQAREPNRLDERADCPRPPRQPLTSNKMGANSSRPSGTEPPHVWKG
jgi:hypothetical protein